MTESLKTLHVTPNKSNNIFDPARLPWDISLYGVVSLLVMLEFAAHDYLEISHRFGLLLGMVKRQNPDPNVLGESLTILWDQTIRLGLVVTKEHLICLMEDLAKENPTSVKFTRHNDLVDISIRGAKLDATKMSSHIETLYRTLRAELASNLLRAIPKEKASFLDPKWLTDTILFQKFPDTVDEFQRAGRCFAYGENTACIFHLMRIIDFCLKKVADSLPGVSYDARSWKGIGDNIKRKMEQKYQEKSDDWKKKEPFYAEILTDIQAISRGYRNPALHELEKKYDEREARYMLTVIERFAQHVAEKLSHPPPPATEPADP